MMRLFAALVILAVPAPIFAQDWVEYENRPDRFQLNFPGQPTIRETTYRPQRGGALPARVYSVEQGARRYSMTVVNLDAVQQPSDVKGSIAWEAWNFRKTAA